MACYELEYDHTGCNTYWLNAARDDAREELRASEQLLALIDILARQDASPATSAAQIRALVQAGGFRHLSLHLGEPPASSEQHWLRPLANQIDFNRQSTQLTLEGQRVSIQLEPYSEIEEKIRDASGMILFTVLLSAISIVACWITIGRALAPAQRIEAAHQQIKQPVAHRLVRLRCSLGQHVTV